MSRPVLPPSPAAPTAGSSGTASNASTRLPASRSAPVRRDAPRARSVVITRQTTAQARALSAIRSGRATRALQELDARFERALGTMTMAFQPIVSARARQMFGYEALLRTNDADLATPAAMLDAAERLDRLHRLGRRVRYLTARDFADADSTLGSVFVNLHALDFVDDMLASPDSPLARLAGRVVLEVTERASLDEVPDVHLRVAALRDIGYRIAIDDLGAGHSRVNLFRPLGIDFVKLDMSLVRGIDAHTVKQQLVRSLVGFCEDQRILVIGEGVETPEEADTLEELGCDYLQGYYFARPGAPFPMLA